MKKPILFMLAALAFSGAVPTAAQRLPLPRPQGQRLPPPPAPMPADRPFLPLPVLQSELATVAGDTVRFGRDEYLLDEAARQTLAKQAQWLIQNPFVRANIEGHADSRQTREYALALSERRASAVRNFLLTQGVSPMQLSVVSWGKERPAVEGAHDATFLQNSRVVTVLTRPEPAPAMQLPPPPPPPPLFN